MDLGCVWEKHSPCGREETRSDEEVIVHGQGGLLAGGFDEADFLDGLEGGERGAEGALQVAGGGEA